MDNRFANEYFLFAPVCPGNLGFICTIFAEDNGQTKPGIDGDLYDEIWSAISMETDQTRVLLMAIN
ncbi:hypothetical protein [Pedobacter sp. UYP1]|uniref:hypothetical protein n=1 Tax=Pedobacter sp. UYP1 TaxID=1756396 RepID=UPI003397B14E